MWAPLRVEDDRWLRWWDSSAAVFEDPFYVDTVRRALRNDARALLQPRTLLAALPELVRQHRALPLAGLVLHWSRSGSTAMLRAVGSDPSVLALSEPPPIDEVLRGASPALVASMIQALVQPRDPRQRMAVVKLDPWSTLELPLLRDAFPHVPWAFIWREPSQVLMSHALRGPGAHMAVQVLDPEMFGMTRAEAAALPVEVYRARVLRTLARHALDARDDKAFFVEHANLGESLAQLMQAWGLPSSGAAESLRYDAKRPWHLHEPGDEQVTSAVRRACDEYLADVVDELRRA